MIASRNGHSEVVDKLLVKGANIEAKDEVRKSGFELSLLLT